jgi:thiol-disulfide isomerase/thioredoxin
MNQHTRPALAVLAAVLLLLLLEAAPGLVVMGGFATGDGQPTLPPMTLLTDLEGTVTDLDGNTMAFTDLRGKVVLINLWATWCPPCMAEMPSLDNLWREFKDNDDVRVLCITTETAEEVRRHPLSRELEMPLYVFDPPVPLELQAESLPTTYIFDGEGKVVFGHTGMARWDDARVTTYLKGLLKN